MEMTAIFSGLTALFTGFLALNAFLNRKPVFLEVIQKPCMCLISIHNPNKHRTVVIDEIVNLSAYQELSVITINEKAAPPYDKQLVGERYRLREMIKPGLETSLVFNSKDIEACEPCQTDPEKYTIKRNGLNFFKAAPSYNLIVQRG